MRTSTKVRMLEICREPKRYAELKNTLGIKDPALQRHLKDLTDYGYLEKTEDGSYRVTEDGEKLLHIAQSSRDVKLDEAIFEAVNKKLRLAKPAVTYGKSSTPLERLYNAFPLAFGAEKAIVKKDQMAVLRRLISELLSKLDIKIQGVDTDKMSDDHKERIVNNLLDSLSIIMSYYRSNELAGGKYQAAITLDVTGISEEDKKLVS
ncbi:MAG: hypothetical protein QXP61_09360, partial [Nitrososphaerales archaeon]